MPKDKKNDSQIKREFSKLLGRIGNCLDAMSDNTSQLQSCSIASLTLLESCLTIFEPFFRLEEKHLKFFDEAMDEGEKQVLSRMSSVVEGMLSPSRRPEVEAVCDRLDKVLLHLEKDGPREMRDMAYLLGLHIPRKPFVRRFMVDIDYDASLNAIIRERFEWGAGGWNPDAKPKWEAMDFDEVYRSAAFNSRDRWGWQEKGKKRLPITFINFRRPMLSDAVQSYLKAKNLRPANPKELLACGGTVVIPDDEKKRPANFVPQLGSTVIALQAIDKHDSFVFGGGSRVLGVNFPTNRKVQLVSGGEVGPKPSIELKTDRQPHGQTEWNQFVSFAALDLKKGEKAA